MCFSADLLQVNSSFEKQGFLALCWETTHSISLFGENFGVSIWRSLVSLCASNMAQSTDKDIFGVITNEDKLDGTNYSLWSFLVRNVLVAKGLWDYVSGDEVRLVTVAPGTPACGEGRGAQVAVAGPAGPTPEQKRWDTKDA